MSYFQVECTKGERTTKADFQPVEFGIANAVFQALASRSDTDDVALWLIANGENATLICNKSEFHAAQEANRRAQMVQRGGLV